MAKRQGKFEQELSEPKDFGEGGWVIARNDGETRQDAMQRFAKFFERWWPEELPVNPKRLREDTVRFQFPCREVQEHFHGDSPYPLWCLGETGRGAKPVWVLER